MITGGMEKAGLLRYEMRISCDTSLAKFGLPIGPKSGRGGILPPSIKYKNGTIIEGPPGDIRWMFWDDGVKDHWFPLRDLSWL